MAKSSRLIGTVLLVLLMPLFSPLVTADGIPQQPQINTLWLANEFGENNHAYRVTFADGESYQAVIDVVHQRAGENLDVEILQSWDIVEGFRILDLSLIHI